MVKLIESGSVKFKNIIIMMVPEFWASCRFVEWYNAIVWKSKMEDSVLMIALIRPPDNAIIYLFNNQKI